MIQKKISDTILKINKPFNNMDAIIRCRELLNFGNTAKEQSVILEVLDDLCDTGALMYCDIGDETWAYINKGEN